MQSIDFKQRLHCLQPFRVLSELRPVGGAEVKRAGNQADVSLVVVLERTVLGAPIVHGKPGEESRDRLRKDSPYAEVRRQGQQRERHADELRSSREALGVALGAVTGHQSPEVSSGQLAEKWSEQADVPYHADALRLLCDSHLRDWLDRPEGLLVKVRSWTGVPDVGLEKDNNFTSQVLPFSRPLSAAC